MSSFTIPSTTQQSTIAVYNYNPDNSQLRAPNTAGKTLQIAIFTLLMGGALVTAGFLGGQLLHLNPYFLATCGGLSSVVYTIIRSPDWKRTGINKAEWAILATAILGTIAIRVVPAALNSGYLQTFKTVGKIAGYVASSLGLIYVAKMIAKKREESLNRVLGYEPPQL